ncbi:MAG: hypothetical protein JXR94_12070, partial [Candidatus Hydrogenedentes bacterium]|nr:hypothetical protein [Candidatus Hydrogenedentota bacterium]
MNGQPPKDIEAIVRNTIQKDLPPDVEGRLRTQLGAFRERLHGAAPADGYRARLAPAWLVRTGSVAVALALVAGVFLFALGRSAKPTWADVSRRFDSVPFFYATIYFKSDAVARPVQVELWMQQGGRLRLRAGNHVVFGNEGRPAETVTFDAGRAGDAGYADARQMIAEIAATLGDADAFSLDTLLRALPFGGTLSAPPG